MTTAILVIRHSVRPAAVRPNDVTPFRVRSAVIGRPANAKRRLICRWHRDAKGRLVCAWEPDIDPHLTLAIATKPNRARLTKVQSQAGRAPKASGRVHTAA